MEQQEEMIILKSDIAIVVKKDGTALIQNPTLESYLALYEELSKYLNKAEPRAVAEYCLAELLGRQQVKGALEAQLKKQKEERRNEE